MGFEHHKRPVKSPYFRAVSSGVQTTGPATIDNTLACSSKATVADTLVVTKGITGSSQVIYTLGLKDATVQALATGGTINGYGITTLTATTTRTYTMAGPTAGMLKEIYCISATTTNTAVASFSGATGSTGYFFQNTTNAANSQRKVTFNGSNEGLLLRGVSSVAWFVVAEINSPVIGAT